MKKKMSFFFIGAGLLVFLDQITKIIAESFLKGKNPFIVIKGILQMYYLENHGAAWGMMQGAQIFFIILTFIVMGLVVLLTIRIPEKKRFYPLIVFTTLLFAGGIGNLIDRCAIGYVRDFIYFYGINFPVFNVADICVSASVVLLAICLLFIYKDEDYKELKNRRNNEK